MKITATVTQSLITVCEDGKPTRVINPLTDVPEGLRGSLAVDWPGYHGVNTDAAEMILEDEGLGAMTWTWDDTENHYVAPLVRL